ncbi:lactoylglutathione lyase [Mariprofundus ferrooxydans]|nr:lactoylglutathione lyase [Mariprofundus ferrooxydans]
MTKLHKRKNTMRLLHTMIRVGDLDKAIDFYTRILGMRLLRKKDYPGGRFTLAFVGYGDESDTAVIELTHNWDTPTYDLGNGFGHLAIGVDDIYSICERIRNDGGQISREPGSMKHGTTLIAFVTDNDGYAIELIEKKY